MRYLAAFLPLSAVLVLACHDLTQPVGPESLLAARVGAPSALGSKIAFGSDRDGDYEIYVMNADGSEQTNLTNNEVFEAIPTWSPDGSQIAFWTEQDGNSEIFVMNADGSERANLTNNASSDSYPDWSPDGMHIAFTSHRDFRTEIYVMNADGSEQTRITFSQGQTSRFPTWSPDGSQIAYERWVGPTARPEIHIVNQDGSAPTRLTYSSSLVFNLVPDWGVASREPGPPAGECPPSFQEILSGDPDFDEPVDRNNNGRICRKNRALIDDFANG